MVDAHCVRDEGSFTIHWLLRFIGLGLRLGLGCIQFEEYVNHVVKKAARYPLHHYWDFQSHGTNPNANPNPYEIPAELPRDDVIVTSLGKMVQKTKQNYV